MLLILAALAWLWEQARVYHPFIADDALISLRYSERLLEGKGLTWTDGEYVEGYSNLLWVLLCAALGGLGVDLIDAARFLGILCTALIVAVCLQVARNRIAGLLAGLLLTTAGPIAVWSIGGLEQPLYAASLSVAGYFLMRSDASMRGGRDGAATLDRKGEQRTLLGAGVALGLVCWTRPDGPLFSVCAASAFMLTRAGPWRDRLGKCGWLLLPPVAMTLSQLLFRLAYYGDWVPNTAHIKASVTKHRLAEGLEYLLQGSEEMLPLLALALLGIYASWTHRRRRLLCLWLVASAATWGGYVVLIGGDIFPAHRHLVVLAALWAMLSALGLGWAFESRRAALAVCLTLLGLLPIWQRDQLGRPHNNRARHERWEWESQVIGELFGLTFRAQQPLLAVTAAGGLPYFSGLPSLDMQGLNDRHIALQPPGRGEIGHDHGDGGYVLDRKPDLIAFKGPGRGPPAFVSGQQMNQDPRFRRDYRLVQFEGTEPFYAVSRTWVRIDGKVGIQRGEDSVTVPGYLLEGQVSGVPLGPATMGASVQGKTAWSPPLELAPGVYRAGIRPASPYAEVVAKLVQGSAFLGADQRLHVTSPSRLRVGLKAPQQLLLNDVQLEQVGPQGAPPRAARPLSASATPILGAMRSAKNLDESSPDALALAEWHLEGGAFRVHGKQLSSQRSPHHGEAISPEFDARAGLVLELRLSGGRSRQDLGIRVLVDGHSVLQVGADDSTKVRTLRLDLSAFAGHTLRLEMEDRRSDRYGYLTLHSAKLLG